MAMQPVGHIAGTAAAVTGCISTIMAVPISIYIGRFIAETVCHFCWFSICAVCISLFKIDENLPLRLSKTAVVFTSKIN
jgi:DHA1 family bicyclomycin/chloramphenicol resistance-like MFS transporter